MAESVIDSSVVLACLNHETGFAQWLPLLEDAACSANIIAEIATKLARKGVTAAEAAEVIGSLDLEVHPVTYVDALEVGALHALTRRAGLSLGDRSCLVLARRLDLPAITADRAWSGFADEIGVRVELIR